MTYNTKQQIPKTISLDEGVYTTDKKRFLMKISRIFRQRYECPRVLKLAWFLVGGSKWFKACVGARNLQNRSRSDLFISSATVIGH